MELSPLKYTEKCLKYFYKFSGAINKTGATIFSYKIHGLMRHMVDLKDCNIGLTLILLSNLDHSYGPK